MQALYGFKATITASVWRGNHYIYQAYINSLRSLVPEEVVPVPNPLQPDLI